MKKLLRIAIQHVKNTFFSPQCIGCGAFTDTHEGGGTEFLCARCEAALPLEPMLCCPTCHRRVVIGPRGGTRAHAACKRKNPYLLAHAMPYHHPLVETVIKTHKYQSIRSLAQPLGRRMAECAQFLRIPNMEQYIIVPMPLHPKKERARGFNQAKEIGSVAGAILNLGVVDAALIRIRNTRSQATMKDALARRANITGAFFVPDAATVIHRNILLVDDIATSGATLAEAARTLKENGARDIIALVAARA